MSSLLLLLGWIIAAGTGGMLILTVYTLIKEKEGDKSVRVLVPGLLFLLPAIYILFSPVPYKDQLLLGGEAVFFIVLLLFTLPLGKIRTYSLPANIQRIDERDTMFSRAKYKPGDGMYEEYYGRRPEKKGRDDMLRDMHPLYSPPTPCFETLNGAITNGNFQFIVDIVQFAEGRVPTADPHPIDPASASRMVKEAARYFGADMVGITELKPYHFYSSRGRKPEWYGQEIITDHKYAIVFAMEMDYEMMKNAPQLPATVESTQQYVTAGVIGIQLCNMLQQLGYKAVNNMSNYYQVIAPLVAADAGLGEIGRMGILMTAPLGPRTRLGVVTTDLVLESDPPVNLGMDEFCLYCEKCARECPSKAIPSGPKSEIAGVSRWKIDDEKCYTYWRSIGTDCGVCMNACPYSKPDTFLHRLVRSALKRNTLTRRVFPWLDDYLYGKKPYKKIDPKWVSK